MTVDSPELLQTGWQDRSIREAFRSGAKALSDAGVSNPALDAAVLLGFAAGIKPDYVLAEGDQPIGTDELHRYGCFISLRCERMPVSRIIGYREFYSLPFKVTGDVLTPRPETETLVQTAVDYLRESGEGGRVLDIGTGSGAIAVTLATLIPHSRTIALDISPSALAVASKNANANRVESRVYLCCSDMADAIFAPRRFDLVVSNPPYIPASVFESLPAEVRNGDPELALIAGPTGTEFYGPIARIAMETLKPNGAVMVEIGQGQDGEVSRILDCAGFCAVRAIPDLGGIMRVVTGRKPGV
ncbi:MAG TPA: peptide chain release factor N(5)-glutamine methyltransferase [Proteobacteria bacterium]|nr:release factor glutamine methyltransferase [bacterium BMS3Abin14]HDL53340.1 peptide chain release factor N(5)-glutamine methyltransferase [Pseudomonadota bacterium]